MEVVTRGERRRGWSEEERARILTEALEPGAVVAHVARRWGVSTGQLYTWRKAMLAQAAPIATTPVAPSFAQVQLAAPDSPPSVAPAATPSGLIEIVLPDGALVRVDAAVDGAALRLVLAALSGR